MQLTEEHLKKLETIKEHVTRLLRNVEGVEFLYCKALWNMHDVGPRWSIHVRVLSSVDQLDRETFYNGEDLLMEMFQDVRWNFDKSTSDYPSFENMNWNMNNAGFVALD